MCTMSINIIQNTVIPYANIVIVTWVTIVDILIAAFGIAVMERFM